MLIFFILIVWIDLIQFDSSDGSKNWKKIGHKLKSIGVIVLHKSRQTSITKYHFKDLLTKDKGHFILVGIQV